MAVKTPPSVRSDEALTPRQREVLALIVQGRTNAQIAEALGITLDGAKWHVSEIITRLDVESREEAAEYWRAEHGLRLRFSRMLRSLLPGSAALKFAAGGAVLAIAAAAVAAVVIVLQQSNDEHPASSATPPATAPATSPAATPGATATAGPGAEVIDGVTVQTLSIGSDTTLPSGLVVYYFRAGFAKDGPFANLQRAYRDNTGTLRMDDLSAPTSTGAFTMALDLDSGRAAIGICTQGDCGGYGAASTDAEATLMLSEDGGVTWQNAGPLPTARGFRQSPQATSLSICHFQAQAVRGASPASRRFKRLPAQQKASRYSSGANFSGSGAMVRSPTQRDGQPTVRANTPAPVTPPHGSQAPRVGVSSSRGCASRRINPHTGTSARPTARGG